MRAARLRHFKGTFAAFNTSCSTESWDVGILSWPVTYVAELNPAIPVLKRCRCIVYLGKNDQQAQCGTRALWRYLVRRQLKQRMERRRSTILIYGKAKRGNPLSEEETWGLKAIHR